MIALQVIAVISVAAVIAAFLIADVVAERRVNRENARRYDDWMAAKVEAKARSLPPPFPPNRLVRR